MFKIQNWKAKLAYAGFGCLFGSFCTIIGMLASPVTAQRDKFGDIECTSLKVVDADGAAQVILSTNYLDVIYAKGVWIGNDHLGGRVAVAGINVSKVTDLGFDGYGGYVHVSGKDWNRKATLGVGDHGGRVLVAGNDGKLNVTLDVDEDGGHVYVSGTDGSPTASLGAGEHGGRVLVTGNDGKSSATLRIAEHGGRVAVYGKGEGAAIMAINEYGNGAVSTWDKNGYRQ